MKKISLALMLLFAGATASVSLAQTSEDPNAPCSPDGKMGASSIWCGQFFICDQGKWVRHYCPEGLHYNEYTEACDWPENVDHGCGCYL